jgi:hypothetical protein
MTRPIVVAGTESAQEKVRYADRFIAELPVRPGAIAVHEQDFVAGHGMLRAGLDLLADREAGLEGQWFCHGKRLLRGFSGRFVAGEEAEWPPMRGGLSGRGALGGFIELSIY